MEEDKQIKLAEVVKASFLPIYQVLKDGPFKFGLKFIGYSFQRICLAIIKNLKKV